jgi:putative membrane protein
MLAEYYDYLKAFHIIAVISWMVGLLYLPRLYVYHADVPSGSNRDIMLQTMEKKLLRIIMNPAMIISIVLGFMLSHVYGFSALGVWFHIKMLAIFGLTAFHMYLAKWRKDFVLGKNTRSSKFYRTVNEVPTVFMIIAVIMVIVKPFD